jgi:hypothetical protein
MGYMNSSAIIGIAGLVAGALDLTASATLFILKGGSLEKILQFIASGALGARSLEGGKKTAVAGLGFHFFIALSVATVYYFLRSRIPLIVADPVMTGILYGLGVHLIMSLVVLPLSAAPRRPFSIVFFLTQAVIHMFLVGLPIALIVRRLS